MWLLVIGGVGFIGMNFVYSVVCEYLDDVVIVFDVLIYVGWCELLVDVEDVIWLVQGDIIDVELVLQLVVEFDVVVYFVVEFYVDNVLDNLELFLYINVIGIFIILEVV